MDFTATIARKTLIGTPARSFLVRLAAVWIFIAVLIVAFNVSIGAIGQGLALSLVGVGVYISFRLLNFPDLTVEGSFPIGGAVAAMLIASGTAAEVGLVAAFVAGAFAGLITALITVWFDIDGLLSSIIVLTGAYTITLRVMGSSNIPLLDQRTILTPYIAPTRDFLVATFGSNTRRLTTNTVQILVFTVIVAVLVLILNWFLHTEIGLALRAAGKNHQMARSIGIDDRRMIIIGLMIGNGLAGLAGALSAQQQGFADAGMGVGIIVRGLASVMMGEVLLRPRTTGQHIIAVNVGMIVFEVLRAWVFAALDLQATDIRLVSALVVLAAMAAPNVAARWRNWRHGLATHNGNA